MTQLPQETDGLHPAENLLHTFSHSLADCVAGMTGGATIDSAPPMVAAGQRVRAGLVNDGLARFSRLLIQPLLQALQTLFTVVPNEPIAAHDTVDASVRRVVTSTFLR
jgi:hypothetical protein